jgi:amino acid adenylation domain-containing protein
VRAGAPAAEAPAAIDRMTRIHGEERSNYPLTLSVDDLGEAFWLRAKVKAQVEPARVCALMATALEGLVEALETAPDRPVGSIDVLPRSERARVLEEWNRTDAEYPAGSCIHEVFEAQVERTPDAAAVVFDGGQLSYAELNRRANRLAHHLRSLGVGPDVRVGICVERSPEMMVGLLALLKAGGAYVPLDPAYPADRLAYMLADSAPAAVLTQARLRDRVAGTDAPVLELDGDAARWAGEPEENPERGALRPSHLMYVMYTSGSTGRPKGVAIQHRNVVNRLAWLQRDWGLEPGDAILQSTTLSFDVSVYEILWPISVGGRVVLARTEGQMDPGYLVETIQRERIGTVNFVPSMLQLFLEHPDVERCTFLKRAPCGGEALSPMLARRFRERLPWVSLHNRYGPTEAATSVSMRVERLPGGGTPMPIGRPVSNTRVYVLDARGEPVPAGVAGELYIGGAGVGRGYLGRPELTAERFVADPFGAEPGARLYRTGDLARWLPDGTIEFLGRTDFQAKVRGFRIEPGEIEARLMEHPDVREAVVLVREDAPGDKRLVAYVLGEETAGADVLRAHLGESLPDYMIPAAYVRLDSFPLTPNGKLDRGALPAPADEAYARQGYEAPEGETEEALAEIWAEVLGLERVGRWDDFFQLGGHSLLAVRVVSRVQQVLEVDVALGELFTKPVLRDFAQEILDAQLAQFDPDEMAQLAALLRGASDE